MAVKHGGNVLSMARQYRTDVNLWLDLSTGVSPFTYPVSSIPDWVWNQLPQMDDGLERAAKQYYHGPVEPVAVSGSQAAIMALPHLLTDLLGYCGVVALPRVGYKEHEHAWRSFQKNNERWTLLFYDDNPSDFETLKSDVVVVINPNNPTGKILNQHYLTQLASDLASRNATLVVDEAFVDIAPQNSVLNPSRRLNNVIVLRSVGKFFGLAGARVGFVFANRKIRESLIEYIGPWTVAGPSRWVLKKALLDVAWQKETKHKIDEASNRLEKMLTVYLPYLMDGTCLFKTVYTDNAMALYDRFCRQQILTRLCDEKNALRFGLPASESQWGQLENALITLNQNTRVSL